MLCLTSFLVLHSTTCGCVCIHQQVGQSNTIKEHTLIIATYFSKKKKEIYGIISNIITKTETMF